MAVEKITVVGEPFAGTWKVHAKAGDARIVKATPSDGVGSTPAFVVCRPGRLPHEPAAGRKTKVYIWTYSYASAVEALESITGGEPGRPEQRPSELPEDPLLTRILEAAEAHGAESDPEHEAGDLQTVLRECWKRLSPAARREVYETWMVQEIVTEWGPGDLLPGAAAMETR